MVGVWPFLGLVLLVTRVQWATPLKYLLMPMMSGSHILRHGWVGKGLLARGHEAFMIKHRGVPIPSQLTGSGIQYIDYDTNEVVHFMQTKNYSDIYTILLDQKPMEGVKALMNFFDQQCNDLLKSEVLFQQLKRENFDFALVDAFNTLQCFLAYPRRLGVPYAGLGLLPPMDKFTTTLQTNFITPTLPIASTSFPEQPSLWHRLRQMVGITILSYLADYRQNTRLLHDFLHEKPLTTFSDLRNDVKLWLVDNHALVDVAKPTVPNVIYVGGLTTGPARPLPGPLQKFADSADEGFIVVSFGTVVSHLPSDVFDQILTALNNISYNVILGTPIVIQSYLRPGIKVVSWIPQNDILGHPNCRLLVTHCGSSSQHQAVYHGVPMLGIPFQEEQVYNAQRMQAKGYGLYIDRHTMRADQIRVVIHNILHNDVIARTIRRASSAMKHRLVEPEAQAAYWLEHVTLYGSQHLVAYTKNLAWYEILMLDMIAVVLAIMALPFISVIIVRKLVTNLKAALAKLSTI